MLSVRGCCPQSKCRIQGEDSHRLWGHVKFHEIDVRKMMITLKCSLVSQIFSKGISVVTVLDLKFGMNVSLSLHHNFVNQNSNKLLE